LSKVEGEEGKNPAGMLLKTSSATSRDLVGAEAEAEVEAKAALAVDERERTTLAAMWAPEPLLVDGEGSIAPALELCTMRGGGDGKEAPKRACAFAADDADGIESKGEAPATTGARPWNTEFELVRVMTVLADIGGFAKVL
jgi:hypothetical protein